MQRCTISRMMLRGCTMVSLKFLTHFGIRTSATYR